MEIGDSAAYRRRRVWTARARASVIRLMGLGGGGFFRGGEETIGNVVLKVGFIRGNGYAVVNVDWRYRPHFDYFLAKAIIDLLTELLLLFMQLISRARVMDPFPVNTTA